MCAHEYAHVCASLYEDTLTHSCVYMGGRGQQWALNLELIGWLDWLASGNCPPPGLCFPALRLQAFSTKLSFIFF